MNRIFWVFLVVAVVLASRLPQLSTPFFHLDGDECVLGLMAQHMAAAKDFPFYFWGQHYGFSWIEAGLAACSFKIFGVGVHSLKLPMLLLWAVGCVFFYLALSRWTNKGHAFLVTTMLVLSPAWMAWSMKARGGYVTAFMLSSIALFLMAQKEGLAQKNSWMGMGILCGFIFFAQPMFLIGLLPLLLYSLRQHKGLNNTFLLGAWFMAVIVLGKVMAAMQSNTDFWNPSVFKPQDFLYSLSMFGERIYHALTQYATGRCPRVDWASGLAAIAWCFVFLTCAVLYIKDAKYKGLSAALLAGLGLILFSTLLFSKDNYADRYLLALGYFLPLWFGVLSFQWLQEARWKKNLAHGITGCLLILGVFVSLNYRDYYRFDPASSSEVPEMQKIPKVIEFLEGYGVKYVYSIDDDLSWKISYFSREGIIARWMNLQARQPAYPVAVDEAFARGERVALAGNAVDERIALMIVAREGRTAVIADQYFVQLAPTKDMIIGKMGFQL